MTLGHSPTRARPHILPDFPPVPSPRPPAAHCLSWPRQTAEACGVARTSSVHLQQALPLPLLHLPGPYWCMHFTVCRGLPQHSHRVSQISGCFWKLGNKASYRGEMTIIVTYPNPPLRGLTGYGKAHEICLVSCLAIPCSQGTETERCSSKLA